MGRVLISLAGLSSGVAACRVVLERGERLLSANNDAAVVEARARRARSDDLARVTAALAVLADW